MYGEKNINKKVKEKKSKRKKNRFNVNKLFLYILQT